MNKGREIIPNNFKIQRHKFKVGYRPNISKNKTFLKIRLKKIKELKSKSKIYTLKNKPNNKKPIKLFNKSHNKNKT